MTTLKEALDQLAEGHELDNEQKKLIIDKWQKELGIQHYEDAISREDAIKTAIEAVDDWDGGCNLSRADIIEKAIESLPSVQPQYKTSEWCHDCSEYNHDKHCCPRFNKVIRNTVEEMKQPKTGHWIKITPSGIYMCSECEQNVLTGNIDAYHYCHHCGTKMVEPRENTEQGLNYADNDTMMSAT